MDAIWPKLVEKRPALFWLSEAMHDPREPEGFTCPWQGVVGDGLRSTPLKQIQGPFVLGKFCRLNGRRLNTST